jgi:hypothetical protein
MPSTSIPRILQIGMEQNPDRPYADKRIVTITRMTARAFLESTDRKYDLVLFALPDSLTLVSGASQIRLESFLFTQEALASVRKHLKPHGCLRHVQLLPGALAHRQAGRNRRYGVRARAVRRHIRRCASGHLIGMTAADQRCETTWTPDSRHGAIFPATDNTPFLYFRGDTFPHSIRLRYSLFC